MEQPGFYLSWRGWGHTGEGNRLHLELKVLSWRTDPLYCSLGFIILFSVLPCMFDIFQKKN